MTPQTQKQVQKKVRKSKIKDETIQAEPNKLETSGSIDDILDDIDDALEENTCKTIPLLHSANAASKELVMAENFGLSKRLQPDLKESPKKIPVDVVKLKLVPCDVDPNCDRALFEVVIVIKDSTKSLFFCGHHFREYRMSFFERGYEIKSYEAY